MNKKVFITGITGQDGAYLTKYLQDQGGYDIVGLVRRSSVDNFSRLKRLGIDIDSIKIETFDLSEPLNILKLIQKHQPCEIYNLAAQSFVGSSFEIPLYTMDVDANGVYRMVDAIINTDIDIKLYQASTSEMFGKVQAVPQDETTPFYPRSPYGVAKLAAFWYVKNFRESRGLFGCNGILFNHESPLRGEEFVTRKITLGLARLHASIAGSVQLGNINASRDWGHAADYVRVMHKILQQDTADDYVISSDETHTVREFCEKAAAYTGYDLVWTGQGVDEKGIDSKTGKVLFEVNPEFFRPAEVDLLLGNSQKARQRLNWKLEYTFDDLVYEMMESDLKLVKGNG